MNPRREKALAALLATRCVRDAAKEAGIGYSTIRGYLQEPEFQAAYQDARADQLREVSSALRGSMTAAADKLVKLLNSKNNYVALGAAKSILEYGIRFTETLDIMERIAALEARGPGDNWP